MARCMCKRLEKYYRYKSMKGPYQLLCSILSEHRKALVCEYKRSDKDAKLFCKHYKG